MEHIWIYVIIWVICAFVGGGITSSRGESFVGGFMIALVLGIIGFKIQPGQIVQLRVCWTYSSLMINCVGEKAPAQNPIVYRQFSSVSPSPVLTTENII